MKILKADKKIGLYDASENIIKELDQTKKELSRIRKHNILLNSCIN